MNAPDQAYSALLDHVYQAAVEPTHWPEALARSAQWLEASRALLFTMSTGLNDGGFFYSHGVSPEEMTIWSSRYVGKDFWTTRCIEKKLMFEGSVLLDQDLSSRRELLESDYYREHLSRMQIAWLLSCVVLAPSNKSVPSVACSMYRGPEEQGFDEESRHKLTLLLPHLSRAMGVMLRLREADNRAASSAAALDALGFGVMLLDANAKIVHTNIEARRILRMDGPLTCTDERLRISDRPAQAAWQLALSTTLGNGGAGNVAHFSDVIRVPEASGDGAYMLQVSRVANADRFGPGPSQARLIVFISDEKRSAMPTADLLIKIYKLTPAEARCAQALGEGKLALAAERLGVSQNTLRTQLKRVYTKTGCSTRADLTRLMLSLAAIE